MITSRFRASRCASPPASRRNARPRMEALEGRELMSLGAEFGSPINTKTSGYQFLSDVASSANGSSVAVWVDSFTPTDHDIHAQRFNSLGQKVGPEITVSFSGLDEATPSVAMDSSGNFVVAWMQTLSSGDTNVVAKRFDAAGNPVGSVVQVGVGTFKEHNPDVAMDDSGRFAVAYVRDTNNNNPDVFAKRYDANNNLLNVVNVAVTSHIEQAPSIAMSPDGRFDVAWQEQITPTDRDIRMNTYNASAQLTGGFAIAVTGFDETSPSVAMDRNGNAVVAWDKSGGNGGRDIHARRVSSLGIAGPDKTIASSSTDERGPKVALKRNGGGYVVAYQSFSAVPTRVRVTEVASNDVVLGTFDAGQRFDPSISINGNNDYFVTYTAIDSGDLNIRGRRGHLS